jgi:uncharacterized membrane protein (TIGR02234 family)
VTSMASGSPSAPRHRPRRELAAVLLLGLAGAGLVLLAMRQDWAQVTATAPKPLPAGTTQVTGQDLVPAADALAIAAVACLAAVLATRRMLRRITGVVLAALGAGIAVAVSAGISAADVLAAAAGTAGPAAGPGAGAGAGSVTAGGASGGAGVPLTGFPGHAALAAFPWRPVAIAGALAVIAAGILAAWRAERLPVMSSRYDRPARPASPPSPDGPASAGAPPAPAPGGEKSARDSATMWESLSRGEDPTGNTGAPAAAEPGQSAIPAAEK